MDLLYVLRKFCLIVNWAKKVLLKLKLTQKRYSVFCQKTSTISWQKESGSMYKKTAFFPKHIIFPVLNGLETMAIPNIWHKQFTTAMLLILLTAIMSNQQFCYMSLHMLGIT